MNKDWYKKAYRRNVVDMHITDHDEGFMSQFDPQKYVDMLVLSQVQSAVVYAHSHVGLCYFPTKVGKMHPGLRGRNILKEVVALCHENHIDVVIYCSVIFDTWAYWNNPDWKIKDANGNPVSENSRYGVCCPNSPYRNHIAALVEEVCTNFDLEGIRLDMTFWPNICYCPYCREKFANEAGREIPKTIDWKDTNWVAFQRKREEWLIDFAKLLTSTAKRVKPDITMEHQASTYHASWRLGVTYGLAEQNDFLQGDFYGDALQGSFARKLFYNLSKNRPGGFETSIAVDLSNYTTLKSRELLEAKASAALADGSAFVFIDSIDPVGTLNRTVYERMGKIFQKTKDYESYLGGELCQDVAVYLSTESKFSFSGEGTPHVDGAVSVCKSLIDSHIPFGVITKRNLDQLSKHKVIVLSDILMIDEDEVKAFGEYVREGGSLYGSNNTSLITKDGVKHSDFLLGDVFGVSYEGETKEKFTYITPVEGDENIFGDYTFQHPAAFHSPQMIVKAKPGTKVLGRIALPYFDPADPKHYASIHNNPPGRYTDHPAIIFNQFGSGKAIYVSVNLESMDLHRDIFINLIRMLSGKFTFEADAPKSVEITLFHQDDKNRFIISMVNFQKELPNIPVEGIKFRLRLNGRKPKRLIALPTEDEIVYEIRGDFMQFIAPKLETLAMFALDY